MSETMTDARAAFALPQLPYAENALEPTISARTLSFHYDKHHAGYVKTLNTLVEGTDYRGKKLEEVVCRSAVDAKAEAIFHNAAQAWNHGFYWMSMAPRGGGEPKGKLKTALVRDFGGTREFCAAFSKAADGLFGSGWAWLVADKGGKLGILVTADADTPIVHGQRPLLTIDVWEHAYYLDYQNRRPDYVTAWLDKLVNWRFAESNLE